MIIKLKGGLGNQMFQYAFGRSASKLIGDELFLDISGYGKENAKETPRDYRLGHFNIKASIADQDQIAPYQKPLRKFLRRVENKLRPRKHYVFDPQELKIRTGAYVEGFWNNERYFLSIREAIRSELCLNKPFSYAAMLMESSILTPSPSVSLHIRRGDYVNDTLTSEYFASCDLSYYGAALSHIKEKIGGFNLFVFSDDIAWARQYLPDVLPPTIKTEYVSSPDIPDHEEIMLMSLCTHHIIANSTFSWWGAWLGEKTDEKSGETIVVAPKQWLNDPTIDTSDVVPERWIKL